MCASGGINATRDLLTNHSEGLIEAEESGRLFGSGSHLSSLALKTANTLLSPLSSHLE